VSPAVDGGPEDGPVARGTSGREGPKKKHGGTGSDGYQTEGGLAANWRCHDGHGPLEEDDGRAE